MRPSADQAFMQMAMVLASRSTCSRAAVGALVVTPDRLQIVGIGYNGAARGMHHCNDDRRGTARPGECGCIHAELNAILKAPGTMLGLMLYTTTAPCYACAKLVLNTGIARVVFGQRYRDDTGLILLNDAGIVLEHLPSNL